MEPNQNLCYMHNRAVFPQRAPDHDSSKMSRFQASVMEPDQNLRYTHIRAISQNVLRFTIQAKLAVFELLSWYPIKTFVLRIIESIFPKCTPIHDSSKNSRLYA